MTENATAPIVWNDVTVVDPNDLSDEEARQHRYAEGEAILRVTKGLLNVPARAIIDGRIFLFEGNARRFENQDTNLLELTTEAAPRLENEVDAAIDNGVKPEDFAFTVEPTDLTMRGDAYVHVPFARSRHGRGLSEPHFAQPIVGLDVDEEGAALDITALTRTVRKALRAAATVTGGFTAATGGAFED